MSQRRGRSLDRSRGPGYKPELLIQYDKHDLAFTAWLASVEKIMYAGQRCYVLHFNLHFMAGLSERKRFRGAKFEVELHSSSSTEAPEMLFVRPVSSSGGKEVKLVQGMVLPPNIARWKICEPPKSKDGIPQHVKLQAMVRCRGGFAIEVKDFQVKLGYKDWPWPDRVLRASHRGPDPDSVSFWDYSIATDTGDRTSVASIAPSSESVQGHPLTVPRSPSLSKNIPRKFAGQSTASDSVLPRSRDSFDSMSPQIAFETGAGSDGSSNHAYSMFSSFQGWLDSSRNFDKPEKLKLEALQEFMSATYADQRASLQPGARASFASDRPQRYSKRNSDSSEMSALVGELNSESELLEAWLRRESLRKRAIETCLDTATWNASSHTKRRISPPYYHESRSQSQPQISYEATKQPRSETAATLEGPRKVTAPMRNDMVPEKRQSDLRKPGTVLPPPESKPETSMIPLEGKSLGRVSTIHDGIPEVIAAKPSKESKVKGIRTRVASPTNAEKRWSPTTAWKGLSAEGYAF